MPKCNFNKIAFRTPFRTPFAKSTSGWLLLNHQIVGFKSDLTFQRKWRNFYGNGVLQCKTDYTANSHIYSYSRPCKKAKSSHLQVFQVIAFAGKVWTFLSLKNCTKKWSFPLRISSLNVTFSFLRIWAHLLKKSLMENFIFCAVVVSILYTFWLLIILVLQWNLLL